MVEKSKLQYRSNIYDTHIYTYIVYICVYIFLSKSISIAICKVPDLPSYDLHFSLIILEPIL